MLLQFFQEFSRVLGLPELYRRLPLLHTQAELKRMNRRLLVSKYSDIRSYSNSIY